MPFPKGRKRPDRQNPDRMVRPTEINAELYERFSRFAIGAGETIRDAMEAAMLAYMDGGEVVTMDDNADEQA